MFEPNSRYYQSKIKTRTLPDGRKVSHVARRFPPRDEDLQAMGFHTVNKGDRLDLIASTRLGDPVQFWRIADAQHRNPDPHELTQKPGRRLCIPFPEAAV